MSQTKKDFDECFWAFVYLVISDSKCLSEDGRFIKKIVECGGYCVSVSDVARRLHMHKTKAHYICKDLESKGYITISKNGNKNVIRFNEEIITSGLKLPHNTLVEIENEY